jgi:hypothetical protein
MVSKRMIDIITVVFREELDVLRLQARSIELYCHSADLGRIYVVVNDATVDTSEIDLAWWGTLRDRVTVVHRAAWPVAYAENGWLTQQLLKLMATELCTSTWSMVLDAKTIFVKPVAPVADCPVVGILDIYPVFDVSRQRVNELFGVELTQQLGPGGVPFILNNALTLELMSEVAVRTNQSFDQWFQAQGMVTEFILYSGYVLYKFGSFDVIYNTDDIAVKPCNLCHSEVASFGRKFAEMQHSTTVSVHRRAWEQLTSQQQHTYTQFLAARGIE